MKFLDIIKIVRPEYFDNNKIIQKSLGYNSALLMSPDFFPCLHGLQGRKDPNEVIPEIFRSHYNMSQIVRVKAIKISPDDIVQDGSFVLVRPKTNILQYKKKHHHEADDLL